MFRGNHKKPEAFGQAHGLGSYAQMLWNLPIPYYKIEDCPPERTRSVRAGKLKINFVIFNFVIL